MEAPIQVLRLKLFSRKQSVKPEEPPEDRKEPEKVLPCKTCKYVKSKTCGSEGQHKCRKPPPIDEPSLSSLKDSVSANCYSCCCNLKEFFKEVLKAIRGDPKHRACDVLGEMTDLLLALANDCVFYLKRICKCVFEKWTEES